MINAISENSLGLFGDFTMLDDIEVEPFFHEDTGDVNGHMAQIRLRAPLENPCISPITDDLNPPVGPTPSPPPPPVECQTFTSITGVSFEGSFTLTPVLVDGYSDPNTQFIYLTEPITWTQFIDDYIGSYVNMNDNPEMDDVYIITVNGPMGAGYQVMGTINNDFIYGVVWVLYSLVYIGQYECVFTAENTVNDCGDGSWTIVEPGGTYIGLTELTVNTN
jgi:hypothetical protein